MSEMPLKEHVVFDGEGRPTQVIVPYEKFVEFLEAHGLDLDEQEREELREALADSEAGREEAFVPADEL